MTFLRKSRRGSRLTGTTSGFLTCANNMFRNSMRARDRAYRDGSALGNHIAALHSGQIDPACPACRELVAKQEAIAGEM